MKFKPNGERTVWTGQLSDGSGVIIQNTWNAKQERLRQTIQKDPDRLGNVASWDTDNLYPQRIVEQIETNDMLAPLIEMKARALYSGGMYYGPIYLDETTGEIKVKPAIIPEIEAWIKKSNVHRYLRESANDYYTFANIFPQFGLSRDRKTIDNIYNPDATECRLGLQNKDGIIEKVYVNANWDNGGNDSNSTPITALDQYYDIEGQIRDGKDYTYILPLRDVARGRKYYALSPWHGVLASGWLDIANIIPKTKLEMIKDAIQVKYHIQISYAYWRWLYDDWEDVEPEVREQRMQEEFQSFYDIYKKGGANALFTAYDYDPVAQKEIPGWKIEVIPSSKQDGEYLKDNLEATSVIARAQNIPLPLVGLMGKDKTSGAGSEIRVAWNLLQLLIQPDADRVLEPLDIVASYNDWNKKYGGEHQRIGFAFRNKHIATLDAGETMNAE